MNGDSLKLKRAFVGRGYGDRPSLQWWWAVDCIISASIALVVVALSRQSAVRPSSVLVAGFGSALTVTILTVFRFYDRRTFDWGIDALSLAGAACIGGFVFAPLLDDRFSFVLALAINAGLIATRVLRDQVQRSQSTPRASKVVLVGEGESVSSLYHQLSGVSSNDASIAQIAAIFVDGAGRKVRQDSLPIPVYDISRLKSYAKHRKIQTAIIAVPTQGFGRTAGLIKKSAGIFETIYVAPLNSAASFPVRVCGATESHFRIESGRCEARSERHGLKRLLDISGAVLLGFLTLPFIVVSVLLIAATSKGPVLFKQLRVGKGNRLFTTLKFRTMFVDAHERLNLHLDKNPALREEWETVHKLKNDPRVTPIGKFLRRFSLDELPQIWNVLSGDMSLIGPRPIVVTEIQRYGLDYSAYEAVRPGLTGLWQVSGRNDTTYQERVALDAFYVKQWTPLLELQIVARTVGAVVSGRGAY